VTHQTVASGREAMIRARWHVRDQLGGTLSPSKVAAAELMTSELVSNAVKHAQLLQDDLISLDIYVEPETIRVSVVDAGPGFDPDRPVASRAEGGWGLVLVDRVADRWGIHREHPHSVWFELDR
jgi:serine/threonine-protein kinase RsbW